MTPRRIDGTRRPSLARCAYYTKKCVALQPLGETMQAQVEKISPRRTEGAPEVGHAAAGIMQ